MPVIIGLAVSVFAACRGSQPPSGQSTLPANAGATSYTEAAGQAPAGVASTELTSAPSPAVRSALVTGSIGWPFGPAQTPAERAAQIERLKKDAGPIRSNWVPPGKSDRYGHAEALVAAPYDAVLARLSDFAHYKDLAGPKFKQVRVVDKQAGTTDVYFQLPIMKGVVTIWYITRFAPPRAAEGGGDVIEGTFVKGNIKGMHIAFGTRHGPDDKSTIVVCDLLLTLGIPAPQSNVDEELRDACGDALNAVRARTAAPPPP
ncbi:MAG: hypothetical protein FWD73_16225 [Polyangiaceae bacterium]|nr:hypothetical protein [Polyangiaceae bacterium]